jgi:hypothetical protein
VTVHAEISDELKRIVRENIAGICDSYILHLACLATDNDFIEIAGHDRTAIRALHRASDLVCPEAAKHDEAFVEYVVAGIRMSMEMPTREYYIDAFWHIDSFLKRDDIFRFTTLEKTSLKRTLWTLAKLFLGFNVTSPVHRFLQKHVNPQTIDEHVALTALSEGLAGADIPQRYPDGIAAAAKHKNQGVS